MAHSRRDFLKAALVLSAVEAPAVHLPNHDVILSEAQGAQSKDLLFKSCGYPILPAFFARRWATLGRVELGKANQRKVGRPLTLTVTLPQRDSANALIIFR